MSRYVAEGHDDAGEEIQIAYGYDRPLQTYFWQEFQDGSGDPVRQSPMLHLTGVDLAIYLDSRGIIPPYDHQVAMYSDLPF